jgi:hypothetical protein
VNCAADALRTFASTVTTSSPVNTVNVMQVVAERELEGSPTTSARVVLSRNLVSDSVSTRPER